MPHPPSMTLQTAAAALAMLLGSWGVAAPVQPAKEPPPSTGDAVDSKAPGNAAPTAPATPAKPSATRRDLAMAYIRFDHAYMAHPPAGVRVAEINRKFDQATMLFFSGNMSAVVLAVDALTEELLTAELPTAELPTAELGGEATAAPAGLRGAAIQDLDTVRAGMEHALDALMPPEALRIPAAIAKARAGLLVQEGSETESAQFLADPSKLRTDLEKEIAALEKGENPYRRVVGKIWRPVIREATAIPAWVYAPQTGGGDTPLPLVIALHGAGGDEAMFIEAYGAGQITALADKHGFVVVSPLTYPFMTDPGALDDLISQVGADYAIDPERIYLLGHSMGGVTASMLASSRSKVLAAASPICGGTGFRKSSPPCPVLMIGAELDPIIRAASLQAMAEKARGSGLNVAYRELKDHGHTLAVNAVLPEAVEWLLTKRRETQGPR